MAERTPRLGSAFPGQATDATLYTVPASCSTVISVLLCCNQSGGAITVRISTPRLPPPIASADFEYFDLNIASKDTLEALRGVTLEAGRSVVVQCSAKGVSFNLFGSERDV